jgi:hypothetical protein
MCMYIQPTERFADTAAAVSAGTYAYAYIHMHMHMWIVEALQLQAVVNGPEQPILLLPIEGSGGERHLQGERAQ